MTKKNTTQTTKRKPKLPLFLHKSGQWAKQINGKTHYFGTDKDAALAEYLANKDDLHAGHKRAKAKHRNTLRDLINRFLDDKSKKVDSGDLGPRTFNEYRDVCEIICRVLDTRILLIDLQPAHFQAIRKHIEFGRQRWLVDRETKKRIAGPKARAKLETGAAYWKQGPKTRRRPKTIKNLIQRMHTVFRYAHDNQLSESPIRWGAGFDVPSNKTLRADQAAQPHLGHRDLAPEQIADVLACEKISPEIRAMVLLGINCGMGNGDCARLQFRHINLDTGWLDYPRPKTGVTRRAWLWPETIEALKKSIDQRTPPNTPHQTADGVAFAEFVFTTKYGNLWFSPEGKRNHPVAAEFRKLLKATGHYIPGVNFYALRRSFATIAAECEDVSLVQAAIDLSMGHENGKSNELYRQRLGDQKLTAVADFVRRRVFDLPDPAPEIEAGEKPLDVQLKELMAKIAAAAG